MKEQERDILAAAPTLFPLPPPNPPIPLLTFPDRKVSKGTLAARRLAQLRVTAVHKVWGPGPEGETCRACHHLVSRDYHRGYLKCQMYGVSGSSATDWRAKWPACGAFKKKEESDDTKAKR